MRAMVLKERGSGLELLNLPRPEAGEGQLLIQVECCGVCRTDLHIIDGDLHDPRLPLIPGHEIVGRVAAVGGGVDRSWLGRRVGVPWLGGVCGHCGFCTSGRENLCDEPLFTGYQINGGYAEYTVANVEFCLPLPPSYDSAHAAPLLCAGLIGFRSLRMCGEARRLGFYGFGAAAHIITQVATAQGRQVYAFTRPGDDRGRQFARRLGAVWAGGSDERPPVELEAAIIFAPAGHLVPQALRVLEKGGVVVCAGIYMSDIPAFPYELLWGERRICSVANLTREDGREFFDFISRHAVETDITAYPLTAANEALDDVRRGRIKGAAILISRPL
ncbi:MAG TPA: zinc-binding alcohol dehydrogenase family protein [Desulfobacterales bacterium]|nr:zinc-binding alcohol dehydrogenase family protein [Desulfobacterales bacterium]